MEGTTPEPQNNRHKHIRCSICGKSMRSDRIKRHLRVRNDILAMSDEEVRKELHRRHSAHIIRQERQEEIEEIAKGEGVPVMLCRDGIVSPKNRYLRS